MVWSAASCRVAGWYWLESAGVREGLALIGIGGQKVGGKLVLEKGLRSVVAKRKLGRQEKRRRKLERKVESKSGFVVYYSCAKTGH